MSTPPPARDPGLDPQLGELLAFMDAADAAPMAEGTAAVARASFRTLTVDLRDPASVPAVRLGPGRHRARRCR